MIWQILCFVYGFSEEVVLKNVFKSIWRANAWMDFVHFFSIISVLSLFLCSTSCFHREWLALIRICMISNFEIQGNFKTMHILLKRSHSRWKQLLVYKIDLNRLLKTTKIGRIKPCVWPPDWFEGLSQIFILPKLDASSFSVKSQIAVLNFCHLTSFAKEIKQLFFSVKSSWEVHWIIMFQTDLVCNSYNLYLGI